MGFHFVTAHSNRNILAGSDFDEEAGERKDTAVPPKAMSYFTETDPEAAHKKRTDILKVGGSYLGGAVFFIFVTTTIVSRRSRWRRTRTVLLTHCIFGEDPRV